MSSQSSASSISNSATSSFSVNAAQSSLSINQGSIGSSQVTVTGIGGFTGAVELTALGLPNGVTASFNPNSITGTGGSTLTFIASNSATTGTSMITINGSWGFLSKDVAQSVTASTTLSLTINAVQPNVNFTVSAAPASLAVNQGATNTANITVTSLNGFNGAVNLNASGLPSGVTASFSPIIAGTSTLSLSATSNAAAGAYTVAVTGASGNSSSTIAVNLIVDAISNPTVACTSKTPAGILGLCTFPTSPITVDPGTTAAPLGAPSTTPFNGLGMVKDLLHHAPKHGVPATWAAMPSGLNNPSSMPTISDIVVLNRRDAAILYLPAVAGAADYRAYIYDPNKVTFTSTANGMQPRGAVIACAGTRQRFELNYDGQVANPLQYLPIKHREVVQAIEVPGLVVDGTYQIVVEALASPCPFPGAMGHDDASLATFFGSQVPIVSFNNVLTNFGNEIVNGQGSTLVDYKNANQSTSMPIETIGVPVGSTDAVMLANPVVLARSAISVTRPATDEMSNAPVIDIGPNSFIDDFSTDAIMTSFHPGARPENGSGLSSEGQFGNEYFWMIHVQPSVTDPVGAPGNISGAQVWRRHGRLYSTFGDNGQDIFAGLYFSPTTVQPEKLDSTLYVHSSFRVNSGATERRYWHWIMCGGATPDVLANSSTGIPYGRPVGTPFFMLTGGVAGGSAAGNAGRNVSVPMDGEPTTQYQLTECINLLQQANVWNGGPLPPANANSTWFDWPHSQLNAFIDPAGVTNGIINLKPANMNDGDDNSIGGMLWRLDANGHATEPMFEPFDQEAPLTHYDVFVRPDRIVFYINGRQAFCSDLSGHPLTMQYGLITYGSVLYHSGAEVMTDYVGQTQYVGAEGGSTHYVMNMPWIDTRIWDFISQSQQINIPTQFAFDPGACFKPANTAVQ